MAFRIAHASSDASSCWLCAATASLRTNSSIEIGAVLSLMSSHLGLGEREAGASGWRGIAGAPACVWRARAPANPPPPDHHATVARRSENQRPILRRGFNRAPVSHGEARSIAQRKAAIREGRRCARMMRSSALRSSDSSQSATRFRAASCFWLARRCASEVISNGPGTDRTTASACTACT